MKGSVYLPNVLDELSSFLSTVEAYFKEGGNDRTGQIKVTTGDWEAQVEFATKCQIFNRRIQERPWVIVYCQSGADVSVTYKAAINNNLPVRIRAGGHDHEGECTGTNTVLIDVSEMDGFDLDVVTGIASIGPGNRFIDLTTKLAKKDVMIAHGTCATVGISGYIMGGGWGPWTRDQGMGCESIVGADLVLGNGELIEIRQEYTENPPSSWPEEKREAWSKRNQALLWALRGGGGMSYGLVTRFLLQTFKLPREVIRFSIEFNGYYRDGDDRPIGCNPTVDVLKAWEAVIESSDTKDLIGTNLKISALPKKGHYGPWDLAGHNCIMYGYWSGNEEGLRSFVGKWFGKLHDWVLKINPDHGGTDSDKDYGKMLMSDWARVSYNKVLTSLRDGDPNILPPSLSKFLRALGGTPLPPDEDEPAPHKITSRMVNKEGLGDEGYKAFIESLISDQVLEDNIKNGLFCYVTLGAITGDFYRDHPDTTIMANRTPGNTRCAFPYPDKLYTIQYQAWWNETNQLKEEEQDNLVYNRINQAMDWIESSRNVDIPNTSGAFISFKDSSIPNDTYFAKSYQSLMQIKCNFSEDPYNHLRIRKSIY